jgi:hypothetical protein
VWSPKCGQGLHRSSRMPIYFASLEDPATVDNVLAFLEPYVPHTLGLIGNIVNARAGGLVKAIKVYTSFDVDFRKPSQSPFTPTLPLESDLTEAPTSPLDLFSIIVLRPREQGRFFCSADLKTSEPATLEEETHVQGFFKQVIPIVSAFPPDNEDGPTPEYDISPVGVKGRGYHIGRVHEKWIPCLNPITILWSGPVVCFIRPPQTSPPPLLQVVSPPGTPGEAPLGGLELAESDRWIVSRFGPSDIDFMHLTRSTHLIPRRKAYLESRSHTSIVIHDRHLSANVNVNVNGNADAGVFKEKSNPVAWSIIQTDGSLGVLWVQPSYRGLGLGDLVLARCIDRSETYHGWSGENEVTGTGVLGWQWADVSLANTHTVRFFSRQEGWSSGWGSQWITFDPDVDPTAIDWSFRKNPTSGDSRKEWAEDTRILLGLAEDNISPGRSGVCSCSGILPAIYSQRVGGKGAPLHYLSCHYTEPRNESSTKHTRVVLTGRPAQKNPTGEE